MSNSLLETLQQSLGRDYAIERELGGGGMARVFVAEERALGRRVVLKVLPPDAASGVSVERFKREVQLAARLQHPHIVPLLAAGEIEGILYYTMPFIEGESLRARIAREHELPIPVAVRVLRDVADALAYAHAHDVVHRDIKPDNILLAGPHAVVADFGIAKALQTARLTPTGATTPESITQLGVALGTPAYMAPEQASADPYVDHRADIYALGAVGYEVLTGRPPFTGHSPQALLAAVISAEPQPVAALRPSAPPGLVSLITRCLEKRPADRPQSATEVLQALDAQMTPTGLTSALPTAPTRSRIWLGMGAVVLILLLGVAGVFMKRQSAVAQGASSIAVMPFAPASPDTGLARLGRDLVVTISASLDGVGEIRAADPMSTLGLLEEGKRASVTEAGAVARKLGARSFVFGTLIRSGGQVRLDFALHPVDEGSEPIARASVAAPADSISALSDSATWALLRQVWRRDQPPTPSVAAITTRSMTALRAYLEGERARADGRFHDAVAAFDRAIEADSTFWLAYWRNASTRGWIFLPGDTILRRYRAHLDELPERDRALIQAGETSGVSARIEAYRHVAARFPDYWPAWESAGDIAFHEGPLVGISLDEARVLLQRVVSLNPRWTEAWQHLLAIAIIRDGIGSASVDSILGVLDRLDYGRGSLQTYGVDELQMWRLVRDLVSDSTRIRSPAADSVVRRLAHNTFSPVMAEAFPSFPHWALHGARPQIALSRRVIAAGPTPRDEAYHRSAIEWSWASRGAFDSALALADERARRTRTVAAATDAFRIAALAQWTGAIPGAADQRWSGFARELVTASSDVKVEANWLRGALAAMRSDSAALNTALRSLALLDSALTGTRDSAAGFAREMARSLRAFQLDLRGQRSAAADSLVAVERERGERFKASFPIAISRLTASRWLQPLGRNAEAGRLLAWHDAVFVDRGYWAARSMTLALTILERGRLAEAQGEIASARRFYSDFLQMFDRPMPAHRAFVDEARSALSRLAKQGG